MSEHTVSDRLFQPFIQYILTPILYISIIPVSFIFNLITTWIPSLFRTPNSPARHVQKVRNVQDQVAGWNRAGRPNRMCTGRPSWMSFATSPLPAKATMTRIQLDHLDEIIEIDTQKQILRVEPGLTMGGLTDKLLGQGWTIPVIPEFEFLSIGGCACGTGIETSSHEYGLFADTCLGFEVVLADGSVVNCNKDENSDIFYSIPWSHGSIGFLTAVTLPLIPAKKYVRVEYHQTESLVEVSGLLQAKGHDFIEGMMFALNRFVIMFGDMTECPEPNKINKLNAWYKPWFYKHVDSFSKGKAEKVTEYVGLRDYYHRHERSAFWIQGVVFPLGNSPIFRFLFGWVFPVNYNLVRRITPAKPRQMIERDHLIQDFMVPIAEMEPLLELVHNEVQTYPLWLCPCKFFNKPTMSPAAGHKEQQYINVGIYGTRQAPNPSGSPEEVTVRKLEKFTIEKKGYQFLYTNSYLSRTEFGQMFDMGLYNQVREKYGCKDAFPHVYDKVSAYERKR